MRKHPSAQSRSVLLRRHSDEWLPLIRRITRHLPPRGKTQIERYGCGPSRDVFRFRIAKSSVFSRRRKTPEERLRSGRRDPYRLAKDMYTP